MPCPGSLPALPALLAQRVAAAPPRTERSAGRAGAERGGVGRGAASVEALYLHWWGWWFG